MFVNGGSGDDCTDEPLLTEGTLDGTALVEYGNVYVVVVYAGCWSRVGVVGGAFELFAAGANCNRSEVGVGGTPTAMEGEIIGVNCRRPGVGGGICPTETWPLWLPILCDGEDTPLGEFISAGLAVPNCAPLD